MVTAVIFLVENNSQQWTSHWVNRISDYVFLQQGRGRDRRRYFMICNTTRAEAQTILSMISRLCLCIIPPCNDARYLDIGNHGVPVTGVLMWFVAIMPFACDCYSPRCRQNGSHLCEGFNETSIVIGVLRSGNARNSDAEMHQRSDLMSSIIYIEVVSGLFDE